MDVDIKNTFVIDASFVLAFLLDEHNTRVESIFKKQARREINFIAPSILKYEVGNSLRTKLLRKKLKKERAQKLYQSFLAINIKEEALDFYDVLGVALEKNLSFYDASYLYLAKNNKISLLSLDHSLK
ncbi:conserved hypothetical protein [Candidatus Roizmanbacteria bacterium]|nr:conserved hypothetical protein [Candidatus Roizmanbacteria bacterium]